MRAGAGPGSPAPAGSVEQSGDRARADSAAALTDREGLAGVERDRLAKRDGNLHRLPWHDRGRNGAVAAAACAAEVQHAGNVRSADVELRAVTRTHRCAPTAWSTCPIVPMLRCGLSRTYACLVMTA